MPPRPITFTRRNAPQRAPTASASVCRTARAADGRNRCRQRIAARAIVRQQFLHVAERAGIRGMLGKIALALLRRKIRELMEELDHLGSHGVPPPPAQFALQPGSRHSRIAHDRLLGHLHHRGRLLDAQPAKESELDDLRPPRVDCRQRTQRVVERHQLGSASPGHIGNLIEIHARLLPAPLRRGPRACVVEQYVSHDARR